MKLYHLFNPAERLVVWDSRVQLFLAPTPPFSGDLAAGLGVSVAFAPEIARQAVLPSINFEVTADVDGTAGKAVDLAVDMSVGAGMVGLVARHGDLPVGLGFGVALTAQTPEDEDATSFGAGIGVVFDAEIIVAAGAATELPLRRTHIF